MSNEVFDAKAEAAGFVQGLRDFSEDRFAVMTYREAHAILLREVADLRKQRDDLHRACNEEVERRRAAERSTASAMVREFSRVFGVPIADRPTLPDFDLAKLRTDLLREEFEEYIEAEASDDLVGIADALADMLYIIHGTALCYGIPLDEVFAEVHRSNMAKLGPDGKPTMRADGKVMKPEGWTPPDIAGILELAGGAR